MGNLTSASTSYRTPRGVVSASWNLSEKELSYNVTVPIGSKGTAYLDSTSVTESGLRLQTGNDGILNVFFEDGQTVVSIGSGDYKFLADLE